jgi:hypothetical protein
MKSLHKLQHEELHPALHYACLTTKIRETLVFDVQIKLEALIKFHQCLQPCPQERNFKGQNISVSSWSPSEACRNLSVRHRSSSVILGVISSKVSTTHTRKEPIFRLGNVE